MITGYPKIYHLGHKDVAGIFDGQVVLEEKVDGSQLSFMVENNNIVAKSHNQIFNINNPQKLFAHACATFIGLFKSGKLLDMHTYRGESLCKPKHNVLNYDRVPNGGIIIFDIESPGGYYSPEQKKKICDSIGLECVPVLHVCDQEITMETIQKLLETTSVLGGQKIEGIVIKNYVNNLFAKYVSESFKEVAGNNREKNKVFSEPIKEIGARYRSVPRWNKAIIHLKEDGKINGDPSDIGTIIRAVLDDVQLECIDEIKAALFSAHWKGLSCEIISGLPQWYKESLAREQFNGPNNQ